MGRLNLFRRASRRPADAAGDLRAATGAAWHEDVMRAAGAQGALPYLVEGFTEINEAVRRGHAVLLKREAAEVADGITVFADAPGTALDAPGTAPDMRDGSLILARRDLQPPIGADPVGYFRRLGGSLLVTISRFDVRTARFVVQDGASAIGAIELTPKRLARYVSEPRRAVGVALGAR